MTRGPIPAALASSRPRPLACGCGGGAQLEVLQVLTKRRSKRSENTEGQPKIVWSPSPERNRARGSQVAPRWLLRILTHPHVEKSLFLERPLLTTRLRLT